VEPQRVRTPTLLALHASALQLSMAPNIFKKGFKNFVARLHARLWHLFLPVNVFFQEFSLIVYFERFAYTVFKFAQVLYK